MRLRTFCCLFLFLVFTAESSWPGQAPPIAGAPSPAGKTENPPSFLELAPITPQLLERWGISVEKYLTLSPEEKRRLQKELTQREIGRLRALELVRRVAEQKCRREKRPDCEESWKPYVAENGLLTEAGKILVEEFASKRLGKRLLKAGKADLRTKDGAKPTDEEFARGRAYFDGAPKPEERDSLASRMIWDAHFRNETVYSVTARDPKTQFTFEIGQLGVDGRSALLDKSPYVNLGKRWESDPGSPTQINIATQLAYLDLASNLFGAPLGADPGVSQALQLGSQLGLPPNKLSPLSQSLSYNDPTIHQGMLVTSELSQVSHAFNFWGPLDVVGTASNLTKIVYIAPNTAFDETAGARVKLAQDGTSLGVFGGATQNVSPIGNRLFQEALATNTITPGVNVENAPHATAALWGQVPGLSDVKFSLSGTQRWNKDTTVRQGETALMSTFLNHPMTLRGTYRREKGPEIEFDREKMRAQVEYRLSDKAQAYAGYERDRIQYGNAALDSKMFLGGVDIPFGGNQTITIDHIFGGQYKQAAFGPQMAESMAFINEALTGSLVVAENANLLYQQLLGDQGGGGGGGSGLGGLSVGLSQLNPQLYSALLAELRQRGLNPAQARLLAGLRPLDDGSGGGSGAGSQNPTPVDDISAYAIAHQADILQLIGYLSDERVWDAVLIRGVRSGLISALGQYGSVDYPILGQTLHLQLNAPFLVALSDMFGSRLSPVAPLKKEQIDPALMSAVGRSLGLNADQSNAQGITAQLFNMANAQIQQNLAARLGPTIDGLLTQAGGGSYDPDVIAGAILGSLPPQTAGALTQIYGPNLAGLLPPAGTPPDQVRDYLVNQLAGNLSAALQQTYGPQIAASVAQIASWAGDLIRREINMTLIQLLLAAEEIDRLTVDHGLKAGDLSVQHSIATLQKFDKASRQKASDRLQRVLKAVKEETAQDEALLAEKFKAYGKSSLQTMQLDPSWPRGLSVKVEEDSWAGLLSAFGDKNIFLLIGSMAGKYRALPSPPSTTVTLVYAPRDVSVSIERRTDSPNVKILINRPRDKWDVELKLKGLEKFVSP